MTRDKANEILFLWKVGAELFPRHVINQALYTTGDLCGPDLEAESGLVRFPGLPAWMEGAGVGLGSSTGPRASGVLLEVTGPIGGGDAA